MHYYYRVTLIATCLVIAGVAITIWHFFNMLKPKPLDPDEFVAIRPSESRWALLIGLAFIVVGALLYMTAACSVVSPPLPPSPPNTHLIELQ